MDNDILLENGTNEFELLEFMVNHHRFGINVAKICELLPYTEPTEVPNAHPGIEGIFMARGTVITMINLFQIIHEESENELENDMLIMTSFNELFLAFHVSQVLGIHRISWKDIVKPDETQMDSQEHMITGVFQQEGQTIYMLDFESIVSSINPETGIRASQVDRIEKKDRTGKKLLLAEDSQMLGAMISECLQTAGYDVKQVANGREALEYLQELTLAGTLSEQVDGLITDIEMPEMDGYHLITNLHDAEHTALASLPIVIFSSILSDEMKAWGVANGVEAQLSKPEIGQLVDTLDRILLQ